MGGLNSPLHITAGESGMTLHASRKNEWTTITLAVHWMMWDVRAGHGYLVGVAVAAGAVVGAVVGVELGVLPPGTQATFDLSVPNIDWISASDWREAMVMLVLEIAPTQIIVLLSCALWMHWVLLLMPWWRGASEKLTGPIFGRT